ncbi:MAG: efflux RND transporter periplasmic adaptor subunit [Acidobacteria bacterium]|nr:efflux RND transporter periplasmic adaptor subunit [Acidobacteriota bacterium]
MKRYVAFILGILASTLTLVGCSSSKSGSETTAQAQPDRLLTVKTAPAQERAVPRTVEIVGALAADDEVVVSSEVEGVIARVNVDLGSSVRQGDVVAAIDQRDFQLRVQEAEAALQQIWVRLGIPDGQDRFDPDQTAMVRQAKASYDDALLHLNRLRQLRQKEVISQQELDQADASFRIADARYQAALEEARNLWMQLEQRRAALAMARLNLEKTIIRAPISGGVTARHSSAGERVKAGDRLVTLVKLNPLRLRGDVPEPYAASIYVDRPLTFTVDALSDKTFQGRITRLSPAVNPETRSLTIEAEIDNRSGQLRPGYFARAHIVVDPNAKAVMVPKSAIVTYVGIVKVYVLEGDHVVERQVKLGATVDNLVEISEGVRAGEQVVVENAGSLFNGARVRN